MSDLASQIEAQKVNYGRGWDWLVDSIAKQISGYENCWLMARDGYAWKKSDSPFFNVRINTIKEKFGTLRFYVDFERVEHNWGEFNKEEYQQKFDNTVANLYGFIRAVEVISGFVCEESGERGKIRNLNGWMKTLSDKEFDIWLNSAKLKEE